VIDFDKMHQDKYYSLTLSSVKQDKDKTASTAVEKLLKLISNPFETGDAILVPVSLVVRDSII